MDSATEDLYLQKIEEFVHDEEKIVTFKWLSTNLAVSVTDSKQLLQRYVDDKRTSIPDDLSVTYLLSGVLENNSLGFAVVKENELEDKKVLFTTLLNQQIYSVQKCKDIDFNVISMVDYFDLHNPRESPVAGSVISKNCIKRVFKPKKPLPPVQEPKVKGKTSFFTKAAPKSSEKVDPIVSHTKPIVTKEAATSKPKQNGLGIASFFNKGFNKTETKPKIVDKPESTEIIEVKEKPSTKEDLKLSAKDRINKLVDSESDGEDSNSQSQNINKSKENQKPKRTNKRQRKDNKKGIPSPKRRKRIVERNDSDSDDIFGGDDVDESLHEDVIDNSEEEIVFKPKPSLAPKNKKRKLVDRTFEDADGYIITSKEWIEESPSEDEAEKQKPEELKTEVISEVKPLTKSVESSVSNDKLANGKAKGGKGKKAAATNQPTLMNFFKKN